MADFKRVVFEDWARWVPMLSFGIFFGFFVIASIRALFLGKSDREHMASLPLEDSTDNPQT